MKASLKFGIVKVRLVESHNSYITVFRPRNKPFPVLQEINRVNRTEMGRYFSHLHSVSHIADVCFKAGSLALGGLDGGDSTSSDHVVFGKDLVAKQGTHCD